MLSSSVVQAQVTYAQRRVPCSARRCGPCVSASELCPHRRSSLAAECEQIAAWFEILTRPPVETSTPQTPRCSSVTAPATSPADSRCRVWTQRFRRPPFTRSLSATWLALPDARARARARVCAVREPTTRSRFGAAPHILSPAPAQLCFCGGSERVRARSAPPLPATRSKHV